MTVKELLKEFADEVHKGNYERLPYKVWSCLRGYDDKQCTFSVSYQLTGKVHRSLCVDGETIHFSERKLNTLSTTKTFGDFIEDKWFELNENVNVTTPIHFYDTPNTNNIIIKNEKGNNNMKNTFNFDFGPLTNNDNVHLSPYGIAIKNAAGTWVSYDTKSDAIIDVDIFNFNASKYLFKMPVALKDVAVGDILIHNRKPVFVLRVEGGIYVVDPREGEKKEILLTKNMFGFDFATKVVSMFAAFDTAPTAESPFGNMLPFLMMGEDNGNDIDPIVMFMLMQNGKDFASNPMMLYFLMNKSGDSGNLLPLMFMMNQNKSNSPS